MEKQDKDKYAWTIAHNIICHDRFFGCSLDKWEFMLVPQPKIPFATEDLTPNITFTYNLVDEDTAKYILNEVSLTLYNQEHKLSSADFGNYLICFFK